LKVLLGENLPSDWNGKAWAAYQLAKQASGELLLFSDADTEYHRATLSYAVSAMHKTNADLLTIINHNKVKSFGEKITVPFGTWSILTLLPLSIAYLWRKNQALAAGNGKFLLFKRDCYDHIGGYAAVKDNAIEDVALVKLVKANGYKWRIFDGTNLVSARMYHNFAEALMGFTKNYFALFGYKILVALFVWLWMGIITFAPLFRIVHSLAQTLYNPALTYSVISVLATALLWIILSIKLKYPWYLFLLYPLIIGVSIFIGLRSIVFTITQKTTWKDRRLRHRKIRWL
ncbi:MAG: glycosyltransferase, partial [candidate division WOR-3 bacterium]